MKTLLVLVLCLVSAGTVWGEDTEIKYTTEYTTTSKALIRKTVSDRPITLMTVYDIDKVKADRAKYVGARELWDAKIAGCDEIIKKHEELLPKEKELENL